jgi:hypothetical protein
MKVYSGQIYRLMVVWNHQWWLLIVPIPMYISHIGMRTVLGLRVAKVKAQLFDQGCRFPY